MNEGSDFFFLFFFFLAEQGEKGSACKAFS